LLAAADESAVTAPFVKNLIRDRAYRLTVYQEMLDELRAPEQRVNEKGDVRAVVYGKVLEVLKQAAIEAGEWQEEGRTLPSATVDVSHLTPEQLFASGCCGKRGRRSSRSAPASQSRVCFWRLTPGRLRK
jgi:hypothetical protein